MRSASVTPGGSVTTWRVVVAIAVAGRVVGESVVAGEVAAPGVIGAGEVAVVAAEVAAVVVTIGRTGAPPAVVTIGSTGARPAMVDGVASTLAGGAAVGWSAACSRPPQAVTITDATTNSWTLRRDRMWASLSSGLHDVNRVA